jgi:hypothetical protein
MGALIKAYYPEAASGTVEVFKHGTITRAEVFADWAGEEPTTDYAIDGSGRWKGFVFELVDVRVKDVNGLQLDDWTDGTQDTLVAVQNTGFTGTLEDGSQGNGGIVSLSEILTRIRTSFGAVDGFVRETGTTTDLLLKDALHSVRSANFPFIVVTDAAYGAVHDGVTDDRAAIQRALDAAVAAGGGVVFFPAGTYLVTGGLILTSNKVSLLGAGALSSIISISAAGVTPLTINAGVGTFGGGFVTGLGIDSSVGGGSQASAITITTAPGYELRNLRVRNFRDGFDVQSKTVIRNCDWLGIATTALPPFGVKFSGSAQGSQIFGGSFEGTVGGAGFDIRVVKVDVGRILIDGASISHPSTTVGPQCIGVQVNAGPCRIVNSEFRRSTGAVAAGIWIQVTADVEVVEDGNLFETTTVNAVQGVFNQVAKTYTSIHRGTRERLRNAFNLAGGTTGVNVDFGETMCTMTLASTINEDANSQRSSRMLHRCTVRNTTGGALNLTNSFAGSGTHINGAVTAVPAGKSATWTIKYNEIADNWDEVSFATG